MPTPIICYTCGAKGEVLRVTANLQCLCGSTDIDIYDGDVKTAASPGSGWDQSRPDPRANWNEYQGPTPGYNPKITEKNDAGDDHVCQACNGTGVDLRATSGGYDETKCRNCHGTGKAVYPTENDNPSLDAHTPSGPQLGAGQHGHYASGGGGGSSYAVTNTVTPFKVIVPGPKNAKKVTATQADKIMAMAAKIVETNTGLTTQEAFELARRAVTKFPEDAR